MAIEHEEKNTQVELTINNTDDFIKFCEEIENSETIKKIISYIKDYETNNSFLAFKNGEIGTAEYINSLKRNESIIGFLRGFSIAKNRIIEDKAKQQDEQVKEENK